MIFANVSKVTDRQKKKKDLTKIFGVNCNVCVWPKINFLYFCHKVLQLLFKRGRVGAIAMLCLYFIGSLMF
jgi:hypothetical protein